MDKEIDQLARDFCKATPRINPESGVVFFERLVSLLKKATETNPDEYTEVSDNDSHRYIIPYNKRDEWDNFLHIPEEDPMSWVVPEFAERIDGGCVVFKNFKVI